MSLMIKFRRFLEIYAYMAYGNTILKKMCMGPLKNHPALEN